MNKKKQRTETMAEFVKFVQADPVLPAPGTDQSILQMVEKSLNPSIWIVFAKCFCLQTAAGFSTLLICPQFDIGAGTHNRLFHVLHSMLPPFLFYVVCGIIFVLLGAVLAGLVLSRDEIRVIRKIRYVYYAVYSLFIYMIFGFLGADVILISAFAWILGAAAGSAAGFETVFRIKAVPA